MLTDCSLLNINRLSCVLNLPLETHHIATTHVSTPGWWQQLLSPPTQSDESTNISFRNISLPMGFYTLYWVFNIFLWREIIQIQELFFSFLLIVCKVQCVCLTEMCSTERFIVTRLHMCLYCLKRCRPSYLHLPADSQQDFLAVRRITTQRRSCFIMLPVSQPIQCRPRRNLISLKRQPGERRH